MKQLLLRDIKLFRRGILPALVLIVLFSFLFASVLFVSLRDEETKAAPIKVALVDEDDSFMSRLCISFVEEQSYMKEILSIEAASDETTARALLEEGKYAAVVVLPEKYLDRLMTRERCEGKIILSDEAASSAEIVNSVAQFGELLIESGQQGIFCGEKLIEEFSLGNELHDDFLDKVNLDLIMLALNTNDSFFSFEFLPYSNTGVSLKAHYAVSWLAMILVISGLFFSELYNRDSSKALLDRLFSCGVTPFQFILNKILLPGLFRVLLLTLLIPLLQRFVQIEITVLSCLCSLLAVIAASVIISCTAIIMTEKRNWQGLILACSGVGLFLVGGIVPRSMLPKVLTLIGDYTPFGVVRKLLLPLVNGSVSLSAITLSIVYSLIFFLVYLANIKKIREGKAL